jgi:hypothetical protein
MTVWKWPSKKYDHLKKEEKKKKRNINKEYLNDIDK